MISAFLDTAEVVSGLLRAPVVAERWDEPSVLAEFRVSGLAGHLARAVFATERWLGLPVPAEVEVVDAAGYFLLGDDAPDLSAETHRRIREVGEQEAEHGPVSLADEYDAARGRLAAVLPTQSPDRPVTHAAAYGTRVLTLDQHLLTRLIELTVHADDLAVSLDVPTPPMPVAAVEAVTGCLTRIAVARHGFVPVLRALSRRERAGGAIAAF